MFLEKGCWSSRATSIALHIVARQTAQNHKSGLGSGARHTLATSRWSGEPHDACVLDPRRTYESMAAFKHYTGHNESRRNQSASPERIAKLGRIPSIVVYILM